MLTACEGKWIVTFKTFTGECPHCGGGWEVAYFNSEVDARDFAKAKLVEAIKYDDHCEVIVSSVTSSGGQTL